MHLLEISTPAMIAIGNGLLFIVLGIFGFLFKRFIAENDRRHAITEQRVAANEIETKEVKKNYLKRFEEVHLSIRASANQTVETLGEKIEGIQKDKHQYRYQQARETGELMEKVKNAESTLKDVKENIKDLRDEIREELRNQR